jgi:hypothetical protein
MIQEGSIVQRVPNDYLIEINPLSLKQSYPPEAALCIVVSQVREKDVMDQRRLQGVGVSLTKVIDVLYEGRVYTRCVKSAFKEVKSYVSE